MADTGFSSLLCEAKTATKAKTKKVSALSLLFDGETHKRNCCNNKKKNKKDAMQETPIIINNNMKVCGLSSVLYEDNQDFVAWFDMKKKEKIDVACVSPICIRFPSYSKEDYEWMPEWKLDQLLIQYGLSTNGDLDYKREFACGAFLWPDSRQDQIKSLEGNNRVMQFIRAFVC